VILGAAGLHEYGGDGSGGERALDLALDLRAGLSGKLTFVGGGELPDGTGGWNPAGGCVAEPTKATDLAPVDAGAETGATGALLTGALWRPTE
jgi:hypothetical protein